MADQDLPLFRAEILQALTELRVEMRALRRDMTAFGTELRGLSP